MSEKTRLSDAELAQIVSKAVPDAGVIMDLEASPVDPSERGVGTHLSSRKAVGEEGVRVSGYVQIDSETILKTADDNFPAVIRIGSGPNATYEYADPQVRAQKAQELAEIRRVASEIEHQAWLRKQEVLERVARQGRIYAAKKQEEESAQRRKEYEHEHGPSNRYHERLKYHWLHPEEGLDVTREVRTARVGSNMVVCEIFTHNNNWDSPSSSRQIGVYVGYYLNHE